MKRDSRATSHNWESSATSQRRTVGRPGMKGDSRATSQRRTVGRPAMKRDSRATMHNWDSRAPAIGDCRNLETTLRNGLASDLARGLILDLTTDVPRDLLWI